MNTINIKIELTTDQKIELVDQALDTPAIAYWVDRARNVKREPLKLGGIEHNYCYAFDVHADGSWWTIDIDTIEKGIRRTLGGDVVVNKYIVDMIRNALINDDVIDSDALDVIIQVGIFNEIIFG